MAIKSILAPFNGAPSARSALALAMALAHKRDAVVTGVLAHGVARARSQLAPWLTEELDRVIQQQEETARADIARQFWETVGAADKHRAAFVDVTGDPTGAIVDFARTYDLVVIGRFEAEAGHEHFAPSPDVVALQCGRPVLIVPPEYEGDGAFAHAVLAWDGKRAAARALGDAIHLLPPGGKVTVVSIGDYEESYRREHRDPVMQLRRHGFDADFRLISAGRRGVAEALLGACQDVGASLMVMGAYEHSKFSEDLIGGVTARVLRSAGVPSLMAH
jgi:nucleotide-binding universal stress UspA family protein